MTYGETNGYDAPQLGNLSLTGAFEQLSPITRSEAATQTGLVQYLGDRVLISCQESPNDPRIKHEAARLNELSDREYQIFQMRAYGWAYGTVAEELGLSISTVRTHLHNIYEKICPGRRDSEEAVTFIPIEEGEIAALSLFTIGRYGQVEQRLSKTQQEICDLQIAGHSRQEIALKKRLSASTVRTHLHNIYNTLGLSGNTIDQPGIILRRLAAASTNLIAYYKMQEKLAGGLQPKVISMLKDAELEALQRRTSKLLENPESRPKLLHPLEVLGYLESDSVKGTQLDLRALIAAGLILDKGYQEVMLHDQTAPIAQVVIKKEAEYYLKQSKQSA